MAGFMVKYNMILNGKRLILPILCDVAGLLKFSK